MSEVAREPRFSKVQIFALIGCAAILLWSIPGLFVNPDFSVGSEATAELFLGVDMNGWHAVSGFLIVVPVLVVFRNEQLLPWVMAASSGALYATAFWSLLSERPAAGLFYFPNPTGDAVLHVLTGSIFLAGAIAGVRASQATAAG